MIISPWITLLLAIPVLLLGEWLVRHIRVLRRFNIPTPVAGGLVISGLLLLGNLSGTYSIGFNTKVSAKFWTWLVTIEPQWIHAPTQSVTLPFLVAFFTCIGLNASWLLLKRTGMQVALFLLIACLLSVIQNLVGAGLAFAMGQDPLLGLICGSVSLTGGHGTALGFAADFEKAGFASAATVGVAAATFGLVAGSLLGSPLGGSLIRRHNLSSKAADTIHLEAGQTGPSGILSDLNNARLMGWTALKHLLVLLLCIKAGAWVSFLIQKTGISFPVYIGAMIVGLIIRNTTDLFAGPKFKLKTEVIDLLASIALGIFLSVAMMSLNLIELAGTALPMLIILSVQTVVMALFAWWISFRIMSSDYDAAVMAGGHCGFGLGAMPNAIANMKSLVERFGPAPRAFLVVPLVGSFLVDLFNASNITLFLNLLGKQ